MVKRKVLMVTLCLLLGSIFGTTMGPVRADNNIEKWTKSVFRIVSVSPDQQSYSLGSGFAISPQYVITNWHVIALNPNNVFIFFTKGDIIQTEVVGGDQPPRDFAILKLSKPLQNIDSFSLCPNKYVKQGDKVYALGFPGAADEFSQSFSGLSKDVTITGGVIGRTISLANTKYYQMDTSLNKGNSGGPLLNERGEVVGIDTLKSGPTTREKDELVQGMNAAMQIEEIFSEVQRQDIPIKIVSPFQIYYIYWIICGLVLLIIILLIVVVLSKRNTTVRIAASAASATAPVTTPARDLETASRPTGKTQLVGVTGHFNNAVIPVNPDEWIIIGRDPRSCQLVFPEKTADISRRHCKVKYDPLSQSFIVVDLFSSNGTFLASGERLAPNAPRNLRPGERFYLSNHGNMFEVRN